MKSYNPIKCYIYIYIYIYIYKKYKKIIRSLKNAVTVLCSFKFQFYHDLHNSKNFSVA